MIGRFQPSRKIDRLAVKPFVARRGAGGGLVGLSMAVVVAFAGYVLDIDWAHERATTANGVRAAVLVVFALAQVFSLSLPLFTRKKGPRCFQRRRRRRDRGSRACAPALTSAPPLSPPARGCVAAGPAGGWSSPPP